LRIKRKVCYAQKSSKLLWIDRLFSFLYFYFVLPINIYTVLILTKILGYAVW
jgi:hypothetical protein